MRKNKEKTRAWSSVNAQKQSEKNEISTAEFRQMAELFVSVYCYDQARGTISTKRNVYDLLAFYCDWRHDGIVSTAGIAGFLNHLRNGHSEPEGRWGRGRENKRFREPVGARGPQLYFDYLSRLFDTMVEIEELPVSPLRHLKRPKAPTPPVVPPSVETMEKLLNQARAGNNAARDEAIIFLLYDAGLRRAELCKLRWRDVDTSACTAMVVDGKGGKSRMAMFSPLTAQALLKYMKRLRKLDPGDDDFLFVNQYVYKGQPMRPDGVFRMLRRHALAAGIAPSAVSPHKLRHGFATQWAMTGLPPRAIQALMGHSTAAMTLRYQHFSDIETARLTRAASPVEQLVRGSEGRGRKKR